MIFNIDKNDLSSFIIKIALSLFLSLSLSLSLSAQENEFYNNGVPI